MKKYLLLTLTLILSACATIDTSDLVTQINTKIIQADTDYKLTYTYMENDREIASNEFSYLASNQSFSVKGIANKDGEIVTLTYETFFEGNKIDNVNATNSKGETYSVSTKSYNDIMQNYVLHEIDFLNKISNHPYDNVQISELENIYFYTIQNPEQTDSYQLNKDVSGFSATSVKGEKTTHINLEFL